MQTKGERKKLFENRYIAIFNDGAIGLSDGVGFLDEMEPAEVKKLYKVLERFYKKEEKE
jgi:hypothetical protein